MEKSINNTSDNQPVIYQEIPSPSASSIGIATLSIEKRLNAVNLAMVRSLSEKLNQWKNDPNISCVVIHGAGEKAFCAGGDCIDMYHSLIKDHSIHNKTVSTFISEEYSFFYSLYHYPKPLICWGNGIIMGGGMGLFNSASHRIVTEHSILAMPEATIGLYPDVGGSWFLNKTPGTCGLFLGLTGSRMNASDATFTGIATHKIKSNHFQPTLKALTKINWTGNKNTDNTLVKKALSSLATSSTTTHFEPSNIKKHYNLIQQLGNSHSPAHFASELKKATHQDSWLATAYNNLINGCPTSAHLTFELQKRTRLLSLADIFRLEYGVTMHCAAQPNFIEGTRALLIEKTANPQWSPKTLDEVTPESIELYFTPPCPDHLNPMNHPHCAKSPTYYQPHESI